MATGAKYSRAEALIGVMITFCGGLLLLMLLLYGNISRFWRGRKEITVVFTQVTALRPGSPVRLNGFEVGRVKSIQIMRLTQAHVERIEPAVKPNNIRCLPLTSEEAKQVRAMLEDQRVKDALRRIVDRTMIELTLEVLEEDQPDRYRVDDIVEIKTTLMGDVSVEISSGFGKPLNGNEVLLGRPGDLLGNLAQGIEDVRDVLAELRDVLGPQEKNQIREIIENIRETSADIRRVSTEMLALLRDGRARVNDLSRQAQVDLEAIERQVNTVGPKAGETLGEVDKTVVALRQDLRRGIAEAEKTLHEYRQLAISADQRVVQEVGAAVHENRVDIRELMTGLVRLKSDLRGSSEKLSGLLSTFQEFFGDNRPDLRRMVGTLRRASENLEEATYRIRLRPWELLKSPSGVDQETANLADTARRVELASRALIDLSEQIRTLKTSGNVDPAQYMDRLDELVKQIQLIRDRMDQRAPPTAKETFERKAGGDYYKREP